MVQSPEWRPYLILQKRYVEGKDPHEIAASLYIGDRQFRRDHSRALQVLSTRIWKKYIMPAGQSVEEESTELLEEQSTFDFNSEELDLNEVVRGVAALITPAVEE